MIITDANALRYLILIDAAHVLPTMYGRILVPAGVLDRELQAAQTPPKVRGWLANRPPWLERHTVTTIDATLDAHRLGLGEREGMSLAMALQRQRAAVGFLTDDKAARGAALERDVPVIRTLGLLIDAAGRGLESPDSIVRLGRIPLDFPGLSPFYVKPPVFARALEMARDAWTERFLLD
jgi:predicted nucleic acid-binding protein